MRSASTSTRRRPRCWRASPVSALRSPRASWRIAMPAGHSPAANNCSTGPAPRDASAVHPEAYGVAKKIVAACGRDVRSLMGDSAALKALDPRVFVDERFGLPTVRDILAELQKP